MSKITPDPKLEKALRDAVVALKAGGIIAYPTEAIYGLGCDPFNQKAVEALFALKQRSPNQGFLLIASSWSQLKPLTTPVPDAAFKKVMQTWPGPHTWVFPASERAPAWVRGGFESIALRVTDHPVANALSKAFGGPIVSTSANLSGMPPARHYNEVVGMFESQIDYILDAPVGDLANPTPIQDVLTGDMIR